MSRSKKNLKLGAFCVLLAMSMTACQTANIDAPVPSSDGTGFPPVPAIPSMYTGITVAEITAGSVSRSTTAAGSAYTNGWQWPTKTSDFGGYAGFLASGCFGNTRYTSGQYHIGQDIKAALGASVYPLSEGDVTQISPNGWGTGNVAVIVRHRLSTGGTVIGLYGHVVASVKVGDHVTPTTVLGTVGLWAGGTHVHLGIHPDNVLTSPFGLQQCAAWPATNGWLDPASYLNSNAPAVRADVSSPVSADQQARTDILATAGADRRFTVPGSLALSSNLNWDPNWELRWATLQFSGGRWVTIYHARYKGNQNVRATGFYDPDQRNAWQGWYYKTN